VFVIVLAAGTLRRFENSRNVEMSNGVNVDRIAGCNFHVLIIIKTSKGEQFTDSRDLAALIQTGQVETVRREAFGVRK